jgi:hypothetical protein
MPFGKTKRGYLKDLAHMHKRNIILDLNDPLKLLM